jgi:hypothetical protein
MVRPRRPATSGESARHLFDPRLHAALRHVAERRHRAARPEPVANPGRLPDEYARDGWTWLPQEETVPEREQPLSLGHTWRRQGRTPGHGLTVTPTPDGGVIHPAGVPIPAVIPVRATPATRGRTLHIAAGVDLTAVGAFVDSLPAHLRPANYTVDAGATFDSRP